MGKLLNTKQAAQYLTDHGKPTEKATLDTLRNLGGGPLFCKEDGKKPIWYDTDDLDEYAKPTPMKKYRSTSEYPPELRQKRKPKIGEDESHKPEANADNVEAPEPSSDDLDKAAE